ncbi:MAG: hypothetical protein AMJ95_09135 [Omnitrophica WOR_2 bacterium SM23_72]|nr:MAG: hypothetical protein AMJ95_09135 [Omnitrophica WOR_2 bacterium SM23_72]
MILALVILLPFCFVTLLIFFHFSPKERMKSCKIYNSIIILLALIFCALYIYRTYSVMVDTVDSAWWPTLSVIGSLFIFHLILLVGAMLRNYVFFRKRVKETVV